MSAAVIPHEELFTATFESWSLAVVRHFAMPNGAAHRSPTPPFLDPYSLFLLTPLCFLFSEFFRRVLVVVPLLNPTNFVFDRYTKVKI